jgi:predicted nucleic acid-binding Zn ribbon protein
VNDRHPKVGPRRAPRRLGAALESAIEPLAPRTPLAAVQRVWDAAVGPTVAAEAAPVAERDGMVVVACRSATWAQELGFLADEILEKIRAELPREVDLRGLRFNVGGLPD